MQRNIQQCYKREVAEVGPNQIWLLSQFCHAQRASLRFLKKFARRFYAAANIVMTRSTKPSTLKA